MGHDPHQHSEIDHSGHDHSGHDHGHSHDAGISGFLRYLKYAPKMWNSSVNVALLDLLDPAPGEQVLDIGAGYGPLSIGSAARGASVLAMDPTPSMRMILKVRRLVQRNRKLIRVVDGTAEELPTGPDSVNAVCSNNTMHHWLDLEAGAAEIGRVLAPGGRVILVDELFTDPTHTDYEAAKDAFDEESDHHHGMTMVDGEVMSGLLTKAGLVNCSAEQAQLGGEPVILVRGEASR